jgi:hypothetical protein
MQVSKNTKEKKARRIPKPVGPRLLPLKKAADYLGLTIWSIRERAWNGDIPFVRFPNGRKMFFDVNDLEDFINKNKITYN